MQYNRFLPLVVPIISFALLELTNFRAKWLFVILIIILLMYLFAIRQFCILAERSEDTLRFLLLPTIFTTGLICFAILLTSHTMVQILYALGSFYIYLYLRSIYYILLRPKHSKSYSLENLSAYGNFLSIFFIASAVYGLHSFLSIEIWTLMVMLLLASALIVYQILWVNGIPIRQIYFWVLLTALVLAELAWTISFLSISYYVMGLILAICYYMLIGVIRFYLLGTIDAKIVKMYLIFGFLSISAVLLTARWV